MPFTPISLPFSRNRRRRGPARATNAAFLGAVLASTGLAGAVGLPAASGSADASRLAWAPAAVTPVSGPELGVYTAPGARAITGAADYAAFTGRRVDRVLDFLNHTSWLEITRNRWLLDPYLGSGYRLHLSVPMLPDTEPATLGECAAGAYDAHWTQVAANAVAAGQANATIRPGWEMNGGWYRWAASGRVDAYAGCFRSLVRAMRAVPGQHFTFSWCVNLGGGTFPAEQAYPGDAYVDYVGVDVYDTSWSVYPPPAGMTWDTARERAWAWIQRGDHGLDFWSAFAIAHGKRLGFDEWALTWRGDGHGGGDNAYFVDRILDYVLDPARGVAYALYFDATDSSTLKHDVLLASSVFPAGAAELARRVSLIPAPAPTATVRKERVVRRVRVTATTRTTPRGASAMNRTTTVVRRR